MTPPLSIPFSAIVFGSRYRNTKEYGDLRGTIDSMKRVGSIHPIGLNKRPPLTDKELSIAHEGFVYELVDGGRRYRCLEKLEVDMLYHASYGNPERLGFIFADELSEEKKREMELDENLYRLQTSWIDDTLLVDDLHALKRKNNPRDTWGQEHTAALLGQKYSKSKVSIIIKVAKLLRAKDKEILKCGSLGAAQTILLKRASNVGLAALKKHLPKKASVDSLLENFNIKKGGDTLCIANTDSSGATAQHATTNLVPAIPSPAAPKVPASGAAKVKVCLTDNFVLGDFLQIEFGTFKFHHIVTDIPYGIDMSNLDEKQIASVKAEHDVAGNMGLMLPFLKKSYTLLRPGGFLVFCFDLDHWNDLQSFGKAVGFHVQDWPFIACKTSPCRNNAPAYNRTKNFESIAYFRRDEKSVLRKQGLPSWSTYDFATPDTKRYSHPFAKPQKLWTDIYDAIAITGQSVLDPFAGECSAGIAAVQQGLVPYGVELVEEHYNRGLQHMKKIYLETYQNNVEFV